MSADEHAPEAVKSIWIAIFLMAIPVGYACGYIFGGTVGLVLGWRLAFLMEASFMLPFVTFAFCSTPIPFGLHARSGRWRQPSPAPSPNGVAMAREVPDEEPLLLPLCADDGGATNGGLARGGSAGRAKGSLVDDVVTILRCGPGSGPRRASADILDLCMVVSSLPFSSVLNPTNKPFLDSD